jgi:hypothetical protein
LGLFLLLFSAIPTPTPAWAGVTACIFDGGGAYKPNGMGRTCGLTKSWDAVRAGYAAQGESGRKEEILSGDGTQGDDCDPPQKVNTPPGQVYPATAAGFSNSCFSGGTAAQPLDVCHFWGINHGEEGGLTPYAPAKGSWIRDCGHAKACTTQANGTVSCPSTLAAEGYAACQKAKPKWDPPPIPFDSMGEKASHCKTFRFVSNSCFAGNMASIIYKDPKDHSKGIYPDRCGSSAAPAGYTADGTGEIAKSGPNAGKLVTNFPHILGFADTLKRNELVPVLPQKKWPASMDDANFNLMVDAQANSTPAMTSDYYLDQHFGDGLQQSVIKGNAFYYDIEEKRRKIQDKYLATEDGRCIASMVNGNAAKGSVRLFGEIKPILDQAGGAGLNADEKNQIQYDLDLSAQKLKATAGIWNVTCSAATVEFTLKKKPMPPGMSCNFSDDYAYYRKKDQEMSGAYKDALKNLEDLKFKY